MLQKVGVTPEERVDVKLREIKHVLVQMISLSKLGRLKLGEAQQAYQDVDGDLSKVSTCVRGMGHQFSVGEAAAWKQESGSICIMHHARPSRRSAPDQKLGAERAVSGVLELLSPVICTRSLPCSSCWGHVPHCVLLFSLASLVPWSQQSVFGKGSGLADMP